MTLIKYIQCCNDRYSNYLLCTLNNTKKTLVSICHWANKNEQAWRTHVRTSKGMEGKTKSKNRTENETKIFREIKQGQIQAQAKTKLRHIHEQSKAD